MRKRLFILGAVLSGSINSLTAQITFQKTIDRTSYDYGYAVHQTTDGGYIIGGYTTSLGFDYYLIKADSTGDTLWTRTFGDISHDDKAYSAQQTSDGGYIITGQTEGFGGTNYNIYVVKTDPNGNLQWSKEFVGILSDDYSRSVQQTSDGGYIIAGTTGTYGVGGFDIYLIKVDANGDSLWTRTFGDTGFELGYYVQETADGGFIITGNTTSFGAGLRDVCLIKTDQNGMVSWTKTFVGTDDDYGYFVQQTADSGYIISGYTLSFGAGDYDVYLIKTDGSGNLLWSKTFGGADEDEALCVQQTSDGGYIISGYTGSFGAGDYNAYLIKTDANGDSLWTKTYGGAESESGHFVEQTSDGGYIITGTTMSFTFADVDVYLIKTDADGNSGCHEGSTATIVTIPATQVTSPALMVTSGGFIGFPSPLTGSGGTVTTLCSTTGINDPDNYRDQFPISIFPNPSPGNFAITFADVIHKGEIQIFNTCGIKVFTQNIHDISGLEIHLKNIPGGIYFVKVDVYPDLIGNGEKYYSKKIIIE